MSVSGLAITLSESANDVEQAIGALREHASIEIGPRHGRRLAVTTDTPSPEGDRDLWNWLQHLPGVTHVDVVFVHFDPQDPEP